MKHFAFTIAPVTPLVQVPAAARRAKLLAMQRQQNQNPSMKRHDEPRTATVPTKPV